MYALEKMQKLKGLCKTWWVELHHCLEILVLLYKFVVTCLHSMAMPGLHLLQTEAPVAITDDDSGRDEGNKDYEMKSGTGTEKP